MSVYLYKYFNSLCLYGTPTQMLKINGMPVVVVHDFRLCSIFQAKLITGKNDTRFLL